MNLERKELIAVFLIGCLLGAAAGSRLQSSALHRFWQHGPDTQRIFNKVNHELRLDAKQQEAVKIILEKHHKEMMSMQQETAVKFQAIRMALRADMVKVLNPEQQEKFRAMTARWDAHHQQLEQNSKIPMAP
jgi:Spy/CpxP family protein refolding chaperone